jgi:hypothetical protein
MSVLQEYVDKAMARACYEKLDDGSGYAASIPGLAGAWADGPSKDQCRATVREVLE